MQHPAPEPRHPPAPNRLIEGMFRRPAWLGLVIVLLALAATTQFPLVRTEVDLSGIVSPRSTAAEGLRTYERRFGRFSSDEVLLVRAPTLAGETVLAALEDLVIDLQFVSGVEAVLSLFSIPAPGRASSWMGMPEMTALDPAARLHRLLDDTPVASQILSRDLAATLVVIVPERGIDRETLLAGVAQAAAAVPALAVTNTGLPEINRTIGRHLIRDITLLTPAAVLLCMALTVAIFRSLRAMVVCAGPPVMAMVWFFGWLGWWGMVVDPVMGALPVVLIVLCFSDCMHLYHAAVAAVREGLAQREAVMRALAETLPAMVLTSLTTAVAFLTLLMPDAPSLTRLGQAGVVGLALSLGAAIVLAPLMMLALGAPGPRSARPLVFAAVVASGRRVALHYRVVTVLGLAVLVTLAVLQSQSRIGFSYRDYLPAEAPVTRSLTDMEARGLGSDRVFVVVETEPLRAPATDDPELANLLAAIRAIWGESVDPAEWLEPLRASAVAERLTATDGSAHSLPVQLPITAGSGPADAAVRALQDRLAAAGLADVTRLVGPTYALVTEAPRLIENLRFGLYVTIISITLLVGAVFHSPRVAVIALVPNLIPIMGVEVWLALSDRELSVMNMIALTVAFGIAVDNTLHVLNRFRLAGGPDARARIETALSHAGPPMIATTLILVGGLLVTWLSILPSVELFGGLIALAVTLALLADLYLLPGLLRWTGR